MMVRVVTKAGNVVYIKSQISHFGRHEIARLMFAKWEIRQANPKEITN